MNPLLHFDIDNTKLFIAGRWRASDSAGTVQAVNPSNGAVICDIPDANESDVHAAVEAAATAMRSGWGYMSPAGRAQCLNQLADGIQRNVHELAKIESNDAGLILPDARNAAAKLIAVCQQYATVLDQSTDVASARSDASLLIREPLGVVAVLNETTPTLPVLADTVCPILAGGNACVLIVTDQVALSAMAFAALIDSAGFPSGSFNLVIASQRGVRHSVLSQPRLLAAIHASPVWQSIEVHKRAAEYGKLMLTSRFGKCMHVLFNTNEAQREITMAQHVVRDTMRHTGQHTNSASVLFLQRSAATSFIPRLQKLWAGIDVGSALLSHELGPVASVELQHAYAAFVESLSPARVLAITNAGPDSGHYIRPALINGSGLSRQELARLPNVASLVVVLFDDTDDLARSLERHRAARVVTLWQTSSEQKAEVLPLLDAQKIICGESMTDMEASEDHETYSHQSFTDADESMQRMHDFTRAKRIWLTRGDGA